MTQKRKMLKQDKMSEDFEEPTDPAVPHPAPVARFDLDTLAAMHGQKVRKVPIDGEGYSARHLATAVTHGWNRHEKNFGALLLTVDEYLSALEAADLGTTHPAADRRG